MANHKDIMTERAWKHEEEVTSTIQKAIDNNDINTIIHKLIGKDIIIDIFEKSCENGEIEKVNLLMETGIGIMNEDAILKAAYNERVEIVEKFIKAGISKKIMQEVFEIVIQRGKVKIAELLLENGVNPDMQMPATFNLPGERYLIFATKKGYDEIVDLLIKYGANIYNRYLDNEHPLIIAIEEGYTKVVKVYLKNGLSVSGDNMDVGIRAMKIARRKGFTEIVELLEKAE